MKLLVLGIVVTVMVAVAFSSGFVVIDHYGTGWQVMVGEHVYSPEAGYYTV